MSYHSLRLLDMKKEIEDKVPYDPEDERELEHQQELIHKLDRAKLYRDEKSPWFNNRDIYDWMDQNEKQSISYIKPRKKQIPPNAFNCILTLTSS